MADGRWSDGRIVGVPSASCRQVSWGIRRKVPAGRQRYYSAGVLSAFLRAMVKWSNSRTRFEVQGSSWDCYKTQAIVVQASLVTPATADYSGLTVLDSPITPSRPDECPDVSRGGLLNSPRFRVQTSRECWRVLRRRSNSSRASITRRPHVRHLIPMSAPTLVTPHSKPPHGCCFRMCAMSPMLTFIGPIGLIGPIRYAPLLTRRNVTRCSISSGIGAVNSMRSPVLGCSKLK